MDQDFNTSDALAALFSLVNKANAALSGLTSVHPEDRTAVQDALSSMDQVLGLLEVARASRSVDHSRIAAIARAADAIREELAGRGIVLEDGPSGTRWKVVG